MVFWNCQADIAANEDQQLTLRIKDKDRSDIHITAVYATARERKDFWANIEDISNDIAGPWCIGGDFNVIMDSEEKLGGRPHRAHRSVDFTATMEYCGLVDLGYFGPRFTWCNNRRTNKRIWKRLDSIIVNDEWTQKFQNNYITHLVRTGSDHRSLFMKRHSEQQEVIKYFMFLNIWVQQPDFLEVVQNN
ncbi:uncharacterized protein LOC107819404 [Nicotiana tabacum]|uniref:Uncharacterized protein LOC107819404 n=1 Tax=Nicotiana tabacum TaxID=4097 RepID=A0A1S4CIG1_TOBAC|nr:PREDICTED: uncharacterized protein LOC107819404 [Nicotiana tabacum]